MTGHIAACLCKSEFCSSSCTAFCSSHDQADFDQTCETCYGSTFSTSSYQQCFLAEDAKCQADATCAAYSACITSCMNLP